MADFVCSREISMMAIQGLTPGRDERALFFDGRWLVEEDGGQAREAARNAPTARWTPARPPTPPAFTPLHAEPESVQGAWHGNASASQVLLRSLDTDDVQAWREMVDGVLTRFTDKAADAPAFTALLRETYGSQFSATRAETIRQQALTGDFSWAPQVEIVSTETLNDTTGTHDDDWLMGAYAAATDTIYLSHDLVHGDPGRIQRILMEEFGHALDARLNDVDATGDEGELFSRLMFDGQVGAEELEALRSENDRGVIVVNGQKIEVEYWSLKKAFKRIVNAIVDVVKSSVNVAVALASGNPEKVAEALKDNVDAVIHLIKEQVRMDKALFKEVMQSKILAAVLMVARFIPIPIVALVANIINMVRAAYMVYQGVKAGSFGAIAGGIASLAGGAGNLAGALGAAGSTISTIGSVADAASKASMAYNAIAKKDLSAAIGLMASIAGGGDTEVGNALGMAQKAVQVKDAIQDKDALAALDSIVGMAESASMVGSAGQIDFVTGEKAAPPQWLKDGHDMVTGFHALREIEQGRLESADSLVGGMHLAQEAAQVNTLILNANQNAQRRADEEVGTAPEPVTEATDATDATDATETAPGFSLGDWFHRHDDASIIDPERLGAASPQVGVVGKDGARGAWGIAQSLAGSGARNAEVNRLKNQLLALNPELAGVLHEGQRYEVPDAATPENLVLARGADARHEAASRERRAAQLRADLDAQQSYLGRDDAALRAWAGEPFAAGQPAAPMAGLSQAPQASVDTLTGDYDAHVLQAWSDHKARTRTGLEDVGVGGAGGVMTGLAAVTYAASEIGHDLVDAGLALGRVGAQAKDAYARGTMGSDFKENVLDPALAFAIGLAEVDVMRLSGGVRLPSGDEVKGLIGTDRVGIKYKTTALGVGAISRLSHRWGDAGWTQDFLLEKNFKHGKANTLLPTVPVGGVPVSIEIVPGARFNVTGSRQTMPSLNIDFNVGKNKYIPFDTKLSIEFRKSVPGAADDL
jgi:hypothetical protein